MELTENALIKRLRRFGADSPEVLRSIGDDCAVVRLGEGAYVFTQDAMVEHIHFEFAYMNARSVGAKAVYVNVSDVLSMGAEPLYFLVTVGIPHKMPYTQVEGLYKGMMRAAKEYGVTLLGGDTTEAKTDFFVDISMIGKLAGEKYLGRDTAREGDLVGVTGNLGESAYGLFLLREGKTGKGSDRFVKRYTDPQPPYSVWKELMKHDITHAMMDISDGLIIDLERMMSESKRGAKIYWERLPIPEPIRKAGKEDLALSGGEDYQFLFTFSKEKSALVDTISTRGFPVSVIGEVVKGRGVKVFKDGRIRNVPTKGYEHFGAPQ